jgi:nucleotide-binding universal stress UspA family protein
LSYALDLAAKAGAQVVLLRSVGVPPAMPPHVWAIADASLLDLLVKEAKTYLERMMEGVPLALRGETLTLVGAPWEAICRAAQTTNADLVFIGSHGYSGVDHLLGTTASRVVNHIDRSVVVVRTRRPDSAAKSSP